MNMTSSRILELSKIISTNTEKIDTYLREKDEPQPSFEENGPLKALPDGSPPELEQARIEAIEASIELQQLLQGSDSLLTPTVLPSFSNTSKTLQLIKTQRT